jgi:hypothetical protein
LGTIRESDIKKYLIDLIPARSFPMQAKKLTGFFKLPADESAMRFLQIVLSFSVEINLR